MKVTKNKIFIMQLAMNLYILLRPFVIVSKELRIKEIFS